jgi:hypothetical protein
MQGKLKARWVWIPVYVAYVALVIAAAATYWMAAPGGARTQASNLSAMNDKEWAALERELGSPLPLPRPARPNLRRAMAGLASLEAYRERRRATLH